ncbi:NACHT domain-containing protein [Leptothoe spongobia]|uniref:NACHT domain-containing protein n=1 Tax=Leptothoe spongobia TAU-MAC 1115 TaxID=1967444 RepID=A0A947GR33_9CYAN|nr:NACHT domain-containing protein [Leptothoe spongobia]MBT9317336.1 NACHT domain-containing protein [Leptothoe spongobia TAU-MAC 1115]
MPSIPREYLEVVANQKGLTSFQKDAFVERLANIERSDLFVAQQILHISRDRYSSRMTQVYKKFNVPTGRNPGKAKLLYLEVLDMYQKSHPADENTYLVVNQAIEDLVRETQQKTQALINAKCGQIQILDMNRPIEVEDIFTEVKITDQIPSKRRIELEDLVKKFEQREQQDDTKFTISRLFEGDKVSGIQLVRDYPKLMILGRPGAGKTTFLKYLATFTNKSEILPGYVPIFVSLKDFQAEENQTNLRTHIENELSHCEVHQEIFNRLLKESRIIFLFDGLDEVRKKHFNWIIKQIKDLAQAFNNNRFIITCRLAASEYTFENFLEVEVCEFTKKQIALFARNWFTVKGSPKKAKKFINYIKKDKEIGELATNPLLLTLLCLVFEESEEFPKNQTELYEEGLDILLRKWDVSRAIERPETYRKLSKNKKEDLLSKIAYATFEKDKGLFKKATIEAEIREYVENLPRSIRAPEEVEPDCSSILKSMIAQHGLIVEVAKGIYSFSHRTFHEYFVSLKIVKTLDPKEQEKCLQSLAIHISDYRWQEVFLLAACMLPNADFLLTLIKYEIDKIAEENARIKSFINWLKEKSDAAENTKNHRNFNSIAQVFYFNLIVNQKIISSQKLSEDFILDSELMSVLHSNLSIQSKIGHINSLASQETIDESFKALKSDHKAMLHFMKKCIKKTQEPSIKQKLEKLQQELPSQIQLTDPWWRNDSPRWIQDFRVIIIDYRNLGQNWNFTKAEIQSLKDYYNVNKLLSRCLHGDCYVSREVREEINLSTLLPIERNED